jgi:hypothetical protein
MVLYNPKTLTLFKRGDDFKVKPWEFTDRRFDLLRYWLVTEKKDGMSIILSITPDEWSIHGRSANTKFSDEQSAFLHDEINKAIYNLRQHPVYDGKTIDIYAELVGPGVNGNSHNFKNLQLYAFDVRINDFWLDWTNMASVVQDAGMVTVPIIYTMLLQEIIRYVRDTPRDEYFEGIVARSDPYLYNNKGERLMFKLKVSDF